MIGARNRVLGVVLRGVPGREGAGEETGPRRREPRNTLIRNRVNIRGYNSANEIRGYNASARKDYTVSVAVGLSWLETATAM